MSERAPQQPAGVGGRSFDGSSFLDLSTLSPKSNGAGGSSPTVPNEDSLDSAEEPGRRTFPPGHVHLTRREVDGLRMIIRWLQKLPPNKKFVPDLVRDPDALLADAKRLVKEHKHDDPLLAITDKPVLFWSESKGSSKGGRGSDKDKNGARRRRTRCKKCEACLRADCGDCHFCKDMKKFGGPGRMKQSCISRQCMAPVLPHTACCMLCGRDGWEKGAPQPSDQEACSSLMECSQCWEIVHPACLVERNPHLAGLSGNVSDDLPNSWECPKCCKDGKPDQVKPRHTRGRMSKGPQDGKSECEYVPGLDMAPPVPGNPALNLTLRPYESELCPGSELDPCGAPAKKKIKMEGSQEPLEYDGVPLSDEPVQHLSASVKNGDASDEEMYKNPDTSLSRSRKDDYVRSCARLTVPLGDKGPAASSHDQVVKSMRSLHKGSELEFAEAAVPATPAVPAVPTEEPELKSGLAAVTAQFQGGEDKEDRKPPGANGASDLHQTGVGPAGDFKFKMTLRDRGNLRKPTHLVRPAPLPEDVEKGQQPVKKVKLEDGSVCYGTPDAAKVMVPVLQYLGPQDLAQCQLVCKAWNR
ncbi:hypothetical protein HPB48_005873 [Haemaphysalis longicornis]|uniref:CXXC-type domain-containing protein n=1 Tax=Haemaphysalis longicornis TaxID=44386 RepID=A0A9J6GE03_HAELO|nr:hypothetical protein HPB48_005873 [Haemaphysalis longicornis]